MYLINILKGRAKVRGGGRKRVTKVTNRKIYYISIYYNTFKRLQNGLQQGYM